IVNHFRMPIKLLFKISLFATAFLSSCSMASRLPKKHLVWEENFDGQETFDTNHWTKIPRGTSPWNSYMSDYDSCYALRDGKLVLKGLINDRLPNDTARFLTGGLYTKDKVSFGFGRWEIRAK